MRKKQLQSRLEQLLHQLIHLKTVSFSYRSDNGEIHKETNYTNIYMGFNADDIQNIGWVSENIRGTAYVKNAIGLISGRKSDRCKSPKLWNKAQSLILEYANTPLTERSDKYSIIIGQNPDGSVAVYSKDSGHVAIVKPEALKLRKCFQFTEQDFQNLMEFLKPTFKVIAQKGKTPVSHVNNLIEKEMEK